MIKEPSMILKEAEEFNVGSTLGTRMVTTELRTAFLEGVTWNVEVL